MSRDYKGTTPRSGKAPNSAGSFFIGMLTGLLLGLGIALAVAWYINRSPTPFLDHATPPGKGEARGGRTTGEPAKADDKNAKSADKPRFDFYKILPGAEEPVTEEQFKEAQSKAANRQTEEAFYLQAGAFQAAPEADNLKARLALLGAEATIQTTTLPDKSVWHRVRVGPYAAVEELNRMRDILKQNGIETTLIKVREAAPDARK